MENKVTVRFVRLETPDSDPYDDGEWSMIGIRARALILVQRAGCSVEYTMESAGLWGIESDSGEDYLREVFEEECAQLRADLKLIKELADIG